VPAFCRRCLRLPCGLPAFSGLQKASFEAPGPVSQIEAAIQGEIRERPWESCSLEGAPRGIPNCLISAADRVGPGLFCRAEKRGTSARGGGALVLDGGVIQHRLLGGAISRSGSQRGLAAGIVLRFSQLHGGVLAAELPLTAALGLNLRGQAAD
jgi:hypothetical protein